jgi:hypothetical protein
MSQNQFSSLDSQSAMEAALDRRMGYRAERRRARTGRTSRLILLVVVAAACAAIVAYRDEVQFVIGDVFSKFRGARSVAAPENIKPDAIDLRKSPRRANVATK